MSTAIVSKALIESGFLMIYLASDHTKEFIEIHKIKMGCMSCMKGINLALNFIPFPLIPRKV